MTDIKRAIEDVRMTIVTADAVECKQATFNVESVRVLLSFHDQAERCADELMEEW